MSAADMMSLSQGPPPGAPPSIQIPGAPPEGAPPGPGAMGGLPPELAGLLQQGGPEEEGGDFPDNELDTLDEIRQLCLHYMDIASDDIEKSKMAGAMKIVQDLLAKNQQEQEAAQGTTPAHKGMRRAIEAG